MFKSRRIFLIFIIILLICVILGECRRHRYSLRKTKRTSPGISATFRVVPFKNPWKRGHRFWNRRISEPTNFQEDEQMSEPPLPVGELLSQPLNYASYNVMPSLNAADMLRRVDVSYIDSMDYNRLHVYENSLPQWEYKYLY